MKNRGKMSETLLYIPHFLRLKTKHVVQNSTFLLHTFQKNLRLSSEALRIMRTKESSFYVQLSFLVQALIYFQVNIPHEFLKIIIQTIKYMQAVPIISASTIFEWLFQVQCTLEHSIP